MSKVRTFSRVFPAHHPRAGEPTYFVEKVVKSLHHIGIKPWDIPDEIFSTEMYHICNPKPHTIRAGKHFKVGDKFSPRVWSGKPYQSKQIIIAPDIEVKKVWAFEMLSADDVFIGDIHTNTLSVVFRRLAVNDGFDSILPFIQWFDLKKSFSGQIICWNEKIEY